MGTIPAESVHRQMMEESPAYRQAWADSDVPMQIAFTLCDARRRADLTRAEVASRMGASEGMVARFERGLGLPSLRFLRRYAEATGSRLKIELVSGVKGLDGL